ncbi:MAG TPA: hypothetical protein DDZ90_26210 [Planctomycetaceae bacterium]|nr:hypothetical protein [Planctomycetaceae bacterium]
MAAVLDLYSQKVLDWSMPKTRNADLVCGDLKMAIGGQHTFRHTFVSRALVAGVPEAIIHKCVGHVVLKALKHYTHIADQESQSAMERLNWPDA